MKPLYLSILTLLLAAVVSYATTKAVQPKAVSSNTSSLVEKKAAKESTYDRVMRTGKVRCGYVPWPPYFGVNPNTGEINGVSKDFADATAELLDIDIEYVEVVIGQQVQDLNSGKIDAVCGDGPWIISTVKYIDYTDSFINVGVYLYGRTGEDFLKNFEDFNSGDVTFVGIDGDLSTDLVLRNFPQAKVRSLPTISDPSQLLVDVATKKADVAIIDPISASRYTKNNPEKLKILRSEPVAVYGIGFSVRKGEQKLLNTLNEAVKTILNTGIAGNIAKKYDPNGDLFIPASKPYEVSE